MVQPWGKFAGKSVPGQIDNSLERLDNGLSHCGSLNSKWFGEGFIRLTRFMRRNNYFTKSIADVFPSCHYVSTHLNAPGQQTAKTSALIELCAPAD